MQSVVFLPQIKLIDEISNLFHLVPVFTPMSASTVCPLFSEVLSGALQTSSQFTPDRVRARLNLLHMVEKIKKRADNAREMDNRSECISVVCVLFWT